MAAAAGVHLGQWLLTFSGAKESTGLLVKNARFLGLNTRILIPSRILMQATLAETPQRVIGCLLR